MPKESKIRKMAVELLEKKGWICWSPSKVKFQQNDVFGIIDLLAIKGSRWKKIQLTTMPNVSTRRKKIKKFLEKNNLKMLVEIWAWSNKNKEFKIKKIKIS